ncbi:MAG: DUF2628 domain-containing protein [Marinospirillum sp.]|uniref:DUF2628 domain-containing protein n=1 Tax=Marinospirillum sp. TaxID=2183934 RepID=UPI0019E0C47D|nr:DUF2628 domain-containing protein [Marinospirillum sp.]MBE0508488.1 DUF2628 domain-containing protein [Marinospirillum sp.]
MQEKAAIPATEKPASDHKLLEAYIQKPEKMAFYQHGLDKMQHSGVFQFRWHWSWWAFFFSVPFLLYRKAYLPALSALISIAFASLIPFGGLVAMVIWGGCSSYFVLKRFHRIKSELQGAEEEKIRALYSLGGFHTWVVWVLGIFWALIVMLVIVAMLFAIMDSAVNF